VRLGGLPDALTARAEHILALLGGGDVIASQDESALWQTAVEFKWVPTGWNLVKVPIMPAQIGALEKAMKPLQITRRYSAGGNVAWIATPAPVAELDPLLSRLDLPGLVVLGAPDTAQKTHFVRIGARNGQAFEQRVKSVLDPLGKFSSDI
jgi:hypothetical protein